jgi:hypothetical protein
MFELFGWARELNIVTAYPSSIGYVGARGHYNG